MSAHDGDAPAGLPERLRRAAAEGRLDPDELDERLGAAYGARTIGELAPLTTDENSPMPVPSRTHMGQNEPCVPVAAQMTMQITLTVMKVASRRRTW